MGRAVWAHNVPTVMVVQMPECVGALIAILYIQCWVFTNMHVSKSGTVFDDVGRDVWGLERVRWTCVQMIDVVRIYERRRVGWTVSME